VPAAFPRARLAALLARPWLIVAIALLARLAYMLAFRTWDFRADHNHFAFGGEVGSIARSIAAGHGFASPFRNVDTGPTAWLAPLYPYFCAAVFTLFGTFSTASAVVILTTNSLVSALAIVPLVRLADPTFGRAAGHLAAWAWAIVPYFMCWPAAWVWDAAVWPLLVTLLVVHASELPDAPARRWLAFGALGGIAVLTNPTLVTLMPIGALWAVSRSRLPAPALGRAALAALVCVAVIAPWLVRNRVAMGQWMFIRSNFAYEFWLGNRPGGDGIGSSIFHPTVSSYAMKDYARQGETAFLAARADFPRAWVTEHPHEFAVQSRTRFVTFWNGTSPLDRYTFAQDIWRPLPFVAVTILALMGAALAFVNRVPRAGLVGLACLLYPWPYYISQVLTRRYRHAIEPLLLLLAAYLVVEAFAAARRRVSAQGLPTSASA